jgi:biopolymer transport protein ExbD
MYSQLTDFKRRPNNDDGLIPLINIVFLLLIFFMIAGQISSTENQSIQPPISVSDKPLVKPALVLTIDSKQQLTLNGDAINTAQLETALQAYISGPDSANLDIAVKADASVSAQQLDALLKLIRNNSITSITLFTRSSEDS